MTLKELQAQRAAVAVQMRQLHDKAEAEKRAFTADDDSTWNNLQAELDGLEAKIKRAESLSKIEAKAPAELRAGGSQSEQRGAVDGGDANTAMEGYKKAFRSWLINGTEGLDEEARGLMRQFRAQFNDVEQRAFGAGTGNIGGFTVPQDFRNQLEVAMRQYGGMMEVADVIRTDTGATLPMPSFNYTAVKATIIGEGAASVADTTTPFSSVNLGSFTYRTPILPVSWEFLQDSSFGEGFIADALGRSVAWALNEHATIGTGTGQPRGVALDAVSGKVGATGQTLTAAYDDLVDLEHSVDPVYRRTSKFMMHDTSVRQLRKIKDTSGRPIWLPGYESGVGIAAPSTLLGYEYVVNQDVAVMAANARSILFGDFKKYKLRIVRDATAIRLVERYADIGSVAFQIFMRADGRLLDAGTHPVKFYQNSAT